MGNSSQAISKGALPTLVTVFFFWGFVAASNGIFIPFCKTHFNLDQFQSQLIDTSFYGAYFFGSLLLYLFSTISGVDILNRIGYKNGIILGLSMSVIGAVSLLSSLPEIMPLSVWFWPVSLSSRLVFHFNKPLHNLLPSLWEIRLRVRID